MFTFRLSDWCVKPRRLRDAGLGLHTKARNSQTCTFEGSGASDNPKFHEKTPRERQQENCGEKIGHVRIAEIGQIRMAKTALAKSVPCGQLPFNEFCKTEESLEL